MFTLYFDTPSYYYSCIRWRCLTLPQRRGAESLSPAAPASVSLAVTLHSQPPTSTVPPPTPPLTPPITLSPSHSDSLFITATGVTQESVCDYRFCRSLFLGWALRSASVFSSARRPVRWACCSKTNQQMCVTPHLSQIGTTSGATGHALAESDWTHSAFYFVARDSGVKDGESGATVE